MYMRKNLYPEYIKNFCKLTIIRQTTQLKIDKRLEEKLQNKILWPISTDEDIQHFQSSEKSKLKPQRNIASYPLGEEN